MLQIEKEYMQNGVTVTVARWGKTKIIGRDHGGPSPAACQAFNKAIHHLAAQVFDQKRMAQTKQETAA
jgi:hypothetical protein